jgi:hypothetical protein
MQYSFIALCLMVVDEDFGTWETATLTQQQLDGLFVCQ